MRPPHASERATNSHVRTIAARLIREIRGGTTQLAASRALGFRSNIVYLWETERREAPAWVLFALLKRTRLNLIAALTSFLRYCPAWLTKAAINAPEGLVVDFFHELTHDVPAAQIARDFGVSRFVVQRWLRGQVAPPLPQLLQAIVLYTQRLEEFLGVFAPGLAPTPPPLVQALASERQAELVLRAVELDDYRALPHHRNGWLAARLGLAGDEERRILEQLFQRGALTWDGAKYHSSSGSTEVGTDPSVLLQVKRHWLTVAAQRIGQTDDSLFSYRIFTVSEQAWRRVLNLHTAYYRELCKLVKDDAGGDLVGVVSVNSFRIDRPPPR